MRNALHFSAAALATILSAACGSSSDGLSTPTSLASSDTTMATGTQSADGSTWRLVSINGRAALAGVAVTADFEENRVSGSGGCNRYTGGAAVNGQQLSVGALASTRMYCGAAGVMEQEDAYFSALGGATVYRVVGGELQLGPLPGAVTLVFTRQ